MKCLIIATIFMIPTHLYGAKEVNRQTIIDYVAKTSCTMAWANRLVKYEKDKFVGLPLTDLSSSDDFRKALVRVKRKC